jgi:hypothetical protein
MNLKIIRTKRSGFSDASAQFGLLVAVIGLSLLTAASSIGAIVWDVSMNDPGSTYSAYYEAIDSNLSAALDEYSHRLVSTMPRSIQIEISFSSSVTRSTGYSATSVFVSNVDGINVSTQSVASEIATGIDANAATPDLYLKFQPTYLINELWFDPKPLVCSAPVRADKTDALFGSPPRTSARIGFQRLAR